jgi:hypothetical protein
MIMATWSGIGDMGRGGGGAALRFRLKEIAVAIFVHKYNVVGGA